MTDRALVILGGGYIGGRLARAALAAGRRVRVATRSPAKLQALVELGADVRALDAARARAFPPAFADYHGATIVYGIPPVTDLPAGEVVRRATEAALAAGSRCFVFFSSAGQFGYKPTDEWIDEDTPIALDDADMAAYRLEEAAVESASLAGLHTVTLRLAAVYGPGRGVRERLRRREHRLLDGGSPWVSRIHVDDVARVVFAAETRAEAGTRYLVGDDRPTTQREIAEWLCAHLGLPMPPSVPLYGPGLPSRVHRGRRLRNARMKAELGVELAYPSFVEGELQIDAEERGEAPALAIPLAAEPVAPAVAASGDAARSSHGSAADAPWVPPWAAPPPADRSSRPAGIRHATEVPPSPPWSYPGSDERHVTSVPLAGAVGLQRIAVHLETLAPGHRTSWPHAHSEEEELVLVLDGTPDVWLDGRLHRVGPGDVVGWPPGTGIAHTLINNTERDVRFLVVGEHERPGDRVFYPLHPERNAQLPPGRRWDDPPPADRGEHDGLPDAVRPPR